MVTQATNAMSVARRRERRSVEKRNIGTARPAARPGRGADA